MKRASLILMVASLSAALMLGPGAGASFSASARAGCKQTLHSKRIVRHVKRHGKWRRVVRVRHWWTCVPSAPDPPVTPTPPDPPVDPTPPDPTGPSRLGVESTEFTYTLSRPSVKAGDFIVELNNSGDDPHNLNIAASDGAGGRTGADLASIAAVGPGGQADARFTISPGSYYIYCSLPQHEGYGMHAELLVTP